MIASAGGLDILVFTGGIGEHLPQVRVNATRAMEYAGVVLDETNNEAIRGDGEIGSPAVDVRIVVVSAGEDFEVASQVTAVMSATVMHRYRRTMTNAPSSS